MDFAAFAHSNQAITTERIFFGEGLFDIKTSAVITNEQ